eukprot:Transcript_30924.p2 GENE.Transcript_30924~~Transcript_30924.p2  ORF type:complete len:357 (-),score=130.29 Transcript_30924:284-1354(-)
MLLFTASLGLQLPSALRDLQPQLPSVGLPPALASSFGAYGQAASTCAAVAGNPSSGEAWRSLGLLLHGKGRLEAARTALAHATELAPQDAPGYISLANCLRSIGRFDEATAALRAAEELTGKRDQSMCYYRAPGTAAAATPAPAAATTLGSGAAQVQVNRIATREECEWVIEAAERSRWGNPPPRYAPAGTDADAVRAPHMLAADSPEILSWLNAKLESHIWPVLAAQFGQRTAEEMWLYDAFLLKFDCQPGRSGLGIHVDDDGLGLSFNLLLSSPDAFEGGGTWFEERGETVTPQQGEMVSHHGGLRHASVPTAGGLRYILVGFLRAPTLIVEPPEYVTGYCATARAAAASSRGL